MPLEYRLVLCSLLLLTLGIAVATLGWNSFVKSRPTVPVSSVASSQMPLPTPQPTPTPAPVSSAVPSANESSTADIVPPPDRRDAVIAWLEENQDVNTEDLLRALENNPDTEEFVLQYPEKKDTLLDCTLTPEDMQPVENRLLPLFMQWDNRWGYSSYGGYLFGTNACGPTTLSMVLAGLTGDSSWNPRVVADYAENCGYVSPGGGSDWILMSRGGPDLGLQVEELPLMESYVRRNIQAGNPVVCIMGPGHFTTGGHYIVICGMDGDRYLINDSNSYTRTMQSWDFDTFKDEIRNLWAFSY